MASNALAPYAASMIGQQFGHGENRNEAAQLLSHAVLGAVLAQVNGGSAAAGAVSAAGAEAASNYIAKELYPYAVTPNGDIDASLLTPEQRQNLSSLGAAVGAIGGGLVGNSLYNAAVGSQVGQNAVVNNETGSVIPPKRAASKSRINTSPAFSAGRVSLLKPSYAFALE